MKTGAELEALALELLREARRSEATPEGYMARFIVRAVGPLISPRSLPPYRPSPIAAVAVPLRVRPLVRAAENLLRLAREYGNDDDPGARTFAATVFQRVDYSLADYQTVYEHEAVMNGLARREPGRALILLVPVPVSGVVVDLASRRPNQTARDAG
jgi:hypothetical protein